jgi:hypothetical protein
VGRLQRQTHRHAKSRYSYPNSHFHDGGSLHLIRIFPVLRACARGAVAKARHPPLFAA